MSQADVSDWSATRKSISQCELVIASCTSVAHLAAAMGIETWIVVPVLSYYLWALPEDTSPYYDSAKVFRQKTSGDWVEPFNNIKEKLKCMHTLKMAA
jgi:ADP-heptose:LPS heptosyltransferase